MNENTPLLRLLPAEFTADFAECRRAVAGTWLDTCVVAQRPVSDPLSGLVRSDDGVAPRCGCGDMWPIECDL